jgi:hypothetical protein
MYGSTVASSSTMSTGYGSCRKVEPFGDDERSLLGVRARVIPLELLREGKQRAREAPAEAAKDVADQAALIDL